MKTEDSALVSIVSTSEKFNDKFGKKSCSSIHVGFFIACCVISVIAVLISTASLIQSNLLSKQLDETRNELRKIQQRMIESGIGYDQIDSDLMEGQNIHHASDTEVEEPREFMAEKLELPTDSQERHRRHTQQTRGKSSNKNQQQLTGKQQTNKNQGATKKKPTIEMEVIQMKTEHLKLFEGGPNQPKIYGNWKPSLTSTKSNHQSVNDLVIERSGTYLVYAQIGYLSDSAENGFAIHVSSSKNISDGHVLTRCMVGENRESIAAENRRYRTCYTAVVAQLSKDDRLEIFDDSLSDILHNGNKPADYWGVIRLPLPASGQS